MLVQHKITKQLKETDNPNDYTKTGVWELVKSEEVEGVFGDIPKSELLKLTQNKYASSPKSLLVSELQQEVPEINVKFTDGLI